ncbi:MAG: hypothetical protein LPK45_10580, partial [Bacteroidota bacterium]|nr:hypothetical protein [Bacteroidota bacterium]MDX5431544.1 hypothetical protein [Bacteroidota bacterium]MDX5470265.1 hypothetical protein [Bacteroidota bacterium]
IKFTVSPHTSPFAYIAVAFQGFLAAILYSLPVSRYWITPVFITLAMLESALQKFIIATLIFGKNLWLAIDDSAVKMAKELGIQANWADSFSLKIVLIYCGIYLLWSLFLSIFSLRLPFLIQKKKEALTSLETTVISNTPESGIKPKKNPLKKWAWLVFLVFILSSLFIQYQPEQALEKALWQVLRTVLVLILFLYGFNRFIPWIMQGLIKKEGRRNIRLWLGELEIVKSWLPLSWHLASETQKGWRKYREFLLNLLVFSLYSDEYSSLSSSDTKR